jgi:hypothetical protein
VKRDEAPIELRRPLARLSRSLDLSVVIDKLRQHATTNEVAAATPGFHPRDPQGAWSDFYFDMSNAYARIMQAAGRSARVHKRSDRSSEIAVSLNPYSQKWVKQHAGELCVELSRQQHDMVRDIVRRGYDSGARTETMASQIKRVVGLTSRQEQAVWNYRDRLDDGSYEDAELGAMADRYAAKQLTYRSENIARTENRFAVEHGRRDEWLQARDDGDLPESARRVWASAPASHRLCEICQAMDGQERGLDENFVSDEGDEVESPPIHPSCFPGDALVTPVGRIASHSRRSYQGDIIVVHTAAGNQLTCTPNHPILAFHGWRAAHELRPGDHVLSCLASDGVTLNVVNDQGDMPPVGHQIADLPRKFGLTRIGHVPVSAEDFHGDGVSSEVEIVSPNGELRCQSQAGDPWGEHLLDSRYPGTRSFTRKSRALSFFIRYRSSSGRCMSCGRQTDPLIERHHRHALNHGLMTIAGDDAGSQKPPPDSPAADVEGFGQRLLALSPHVSVDKIANVDVLAFGHEVFNLETTSGCYIAQGLIAHNCRCTTTLIFS